MTRFEKEHWLCNIQNAAAEVAALLGEDTVRHILRKYGADCIENVAPHYFSEVFDELDFIANDARD